MGLLLSVAIVKCDVAPMSESLEDFTFSAQERFVSCLARSVPVAQQLGTQEILPNSWCVVQERIPNDGWPIASGKLTLIHSMGTQCAQ